MLTAVRATLLAGLLLLPRGNHAAQARDTSSLQFLGFRAGARLDELSQRLRSAGGGPLRCKRARTDDRVSECRGVLRNPDVGPDVDLWVSAIDSVAGVMTLSGRVDSTQLEDWRQTLQDRYGRVGTRVQGSQSMLQWVRRGRMIRLTWRLERQGKMASVSLVDGHVLDSWGRARSRQPEPESRLSERFSGAGPGNSRPNPPAGNPEPPGRTP
jgi:hypothetical protein